MRFLRGLLNETAMDIRLRIISPVKLLLDEMVDEVTLPGTLGPFVVLRNHAPIISSLEQGEISYLREGERFSCPISSGFVEVKDNVVCACVE